MLTLLSAKDVSDLPENPPASAIATNKAKAEEASVFEERDALELARWVTSFALFPFLVPPLPPADLFVFDDFFLAILHSQLLDCPFPCPASGRSNEE